MKVKRKYLYAGGAVAGLGLLWWLWPKSSPPAAPSVEGTVTSGGQSVTIEDNVLNPNFGLVVPTVG